MRVAGVAISIILVVVVVAVVLETLLIQWAWNTLLVPTFGLSTIDFWQALAAAVILSAIGGGSRR